MQKNRKYDHDVGLCPLCIVNRDHRAMSVVIGVHGNVHTVYIGR
jgi:hypothetical protein